MKEKKTDPKIKLNLATEEKPPLPTHKISGWKMALLGGVFLIVLAAGFIYQRVAGTTDQIINSDTDASWLTQLKYVNQEKPLQGELEDQINILLLGLGGLNHPGGTLTDTIMVASFKPSEKKLALISIPRDLAVKVYDDQNPKLWEGRKINYAYELGGLDLAIDSVEEVTGLTMHYYVWLDFDGFRQIIDDLGGLDIYVDNGFTDREYPDYNYGYQTIKFTKGWEKMTGERALQYARSRHGNNGEGSDFARAQRQQEIIQAFKDKLFATSTLLNPVKLNNILADLGDHLQTNAEIWELVRGAQLAADLAPENIINRVIDNGDSGLLYSKIAEETGAYVLIPNAGEYNFSEIQEMIRQIYQTVEITKEEADIEIQNGTTKNGLAAQTAEELETTELTVEKIGNALDQATVKTVIYQLSDEDKPNSLAILQEKFPQAEVKSKEEAAGLTEENVDFLIILGADQLPTDNTTENKNLKVI